MKMNLRKALEAKNISQRAVCELLGVSEKTLYNKMTGATEFTVEEAIKIVQNLLPEYTYEYLFATQAA